MAYQDLRHHLVMYLLYLDCVLSVCGSMGVLDVCFKHFPFFRISGQFLYLGVKFCVVGVNGIRFLIVVARRQQVECQFYLEQTIEHGDLALDNVWVVQQWLLSYSEVLGDKSEESVTRVQEFALRATMTSRYSPCLVYPPSIVILPPPP